MAALSMWGRWRDSDVWHSFKRSPTAIVAALIAASAPPTTFAKVASPADREPSAADCEALGFAGRPIAVEVDGDVVPRAALANRTLVGGERIEIVTFVGGG
jgi:sulfur carrier protein